MLGRLDGITRGDIRVQRDVVPHGPGEKLVDGPVHDLALDVPKGDVDAAQQSGDESAGSAASREPSVQLVPEPVDVLGVLTDQRLAEVGGDGGVAKEADHVSDDHAAAAG